MYLILLIVYYISIKKIICFPSYITIVHGNGDKFNYIYTAALVTNEQVASCCQFSSCFEENLSTIVCYIYTKYTDIYLH